MKQLKRKMMLLGMLLTACAASAQTFVSTQPGKRNALIEEYTGVNCQYCPLGHKATDQTVAAFPGRVFAINIHQGTFASRFTTQWGNALAGQASISGYPSSTLSRHAFFGNSLHIDPGQAYSCASEILEMDAPVNVAATVDIDPQTRLMVVKVEAYYTADANGSTLFSRNGHDLMVWDDLFVNITNAGADGPQGPVVGIDEVALQQVSLQLYPNPATEVANIYAGRTIRSLVVMNSMGQVVEDYRSVNADIVELNVAALPAGIYLVKGITDGGAFTTRLCVSK